MDRQNSQWVIELARLHNFYIEADLIFMPQAPERHLGPACHNPNINLAFTSSHDRPW